MENIPLKRYLSGRRFYPLIFLFIYSCTTIQQAVTHNQPVVFQVEPHSNTEVPPDFATFYTAEIKRNSGEYELQVTQNAITSLYKLPSNKLNLIYGMEMGFKDIKSSGSNYYLIKVTANKTKRTYKINTDLISNFITGLDKK